MKILHGTILGLLLLFQNQWTMPQAVVVPVTTSTHSFSKVHATQCAIPSTGSASATCTIPSTTSGNELLIGCASSGTSLSFSPTATAIPTPANPTGAVYDGMYLVSSPTGGTTSVVVTTGAHIAAYCMIAEVSGLSGSVDQSAGISVIGSASTSWSTGSITTTNANDVIIGFSTPNGIASDTFTAGTGYTLLLDGTSSATWYVMLEYKVVTATGANNPAMSSASTRAVVGTAGLVLQ